MVIVEFILLDACSLLGFFLYCFYFIILDLSQLHAGRPKLCRKLTKRGLGHKYIQHSL